MIPFAGGHAYSYMKFINRIKADMEIICLNPSGHGLDKKEPIGSVIEYIDLYYDSLHSILKNEVMLFDRGYSSIHTGIRR